MAKSSQRNEDEDRDEDRDDDTRDDDADEAPPPKAKKGAGPKSSGKAAKKAAEPTPPETTPKVARRAPPGPAQPTGALGKSLMLFIIVVGGLALGFALLGRETGGGDGVATPKWKDGQQVDVELTLVPSDAKDLACGSTDEIAGRHCEYEDRAKRWSKSSNDPDEKILKPYTTTDRIQLLAAGVWDQPALTGKLPNTRFSVKCKFKVDGRIKKPLVRWQSDGTWFDQTTEWYAGGVSDCAIAP